MRGLHLKADPKMTADLLTAAPDFMIIGAMKAGTSTLYDQLARQDGVFMSALKEPAYFADDKVFARGEDWYRALFADAPKDALRGEASTHYTKLPTFPLTVSRMQDMNLRPKFIYVIRNPVQRALSHYLHEVSQGIMTDDIIASFDSHPEMLAYGRYADQLRPFIDAFGLDNIFLTSLEQLKSDPDGELSKIGAHLGARAPLTWDHEARPQNVSAERMRRLPFHSILVESRTSKVLRSALLPQSVRQKLRAARTMGAERPTLPDDLTQRLEAEFLKDRDQLAQIFPGHPALTLCYPFAPS